MSAYDNDPRVRVLDDYFITVTDDDKYDVFARTSTDRWFTVPSLDSRAISAADLRSREETEAWLQRRRRLHAVRCAARLVGAGALAVVEPDRRRPAGQGHPLAAVRRPRGGEPTVTTQIKAVVFDHGGVLTRGGEKGTNEKAASRGLGLTETIVIPDLNDALKRGRIDNQGYVGGINAQFPDAPRRLTMAMWDDIYATLVPDRGAYEFAARCRDAGLRTAILTSINPTMAERLAADGSYNRFDPVIASCYVGYAKPDPEIYRLVENGLPGVAPEEILFLDDQDKCCDGARRLGWQAIRVDSTEQMVRDAGGLLGFERVR